MENQVKSTLIIKQIRIIFIIASIHLLYSCDYWKKYNHDYSQSDQQRVKKEIGIFQDYKLNDEDIKLYKHDGYYIGFVSGQRSTYYISYIDKKKKIKACKVFSNTLSKNDSINRKIVYVNERLFDAGYMINTIYDSQENGKVGITLTDTAYNLASTWDISAIDDIGDLKNYQLIKCFTQKCDFSNIK